MRITRKIAIPVIAGAAILTGGTGIAVASTNQPTPPPTIGNPNPFPTPTESSPFTFPTPTPTPTFRQRRCTVEFDRLRLVNPVTGGPVIDPRTGLPVRAGQWDRVCISRFNGVTITPLTLPIVF